MTFKLTKVCLVIIVLLQRIINKSVMSSMDGDLQVFEVELEDQKSHQRRHSDVPIHLNGKEKQSSPQFKRKYNKNKYINKIKQISDGPYSDKPTLIRNHPSYLPSQGSSTRKDRNRLAAQQTRDRVSLYMNLIKEQIDEQEYQIKTISKQIQQVRLQIFAAEMHQTTKEKQTKHKQMHIIKKMQRLLEEESGQDRNHQINICLDSMVHRVGASGKQRKSTLSKLYLDLLNYSQPALYRYILWSAVKKKHLFGNNESKTDDKWSNQIQDIARQAVQAASLGGYNFDKKGQELVSQCFDLKQKGQELGKFRALIEKKGQTLDNIVNEIQELLTPQQAAKLTLYVQKYQYRKEVCLFDQENQKFFQPRKKVKLQSQIE